MSAARKKRGGPDFTKGVAVSSVADGASLLGHAHGEPVLLARQGNELFAVGASCTHYGGPLAGGLIASDGRLGARDCTITYRTGRNILAVAAIQRDIASLRTEVELERKAVATA